MSKKAMLIITSIGAVQVEKVRSDKKVSRSFVVVKFAEALPDGKGGYYANPFRTGSRNIFQRHSADGQSAFWRVSPDQLKQVGANAIPGDIITKKVEEFPVLGADGMQSKTKDGVPVTANIYTAVVLGGESADKIFEAANHKITGEMETAKSALSELSDLAA